MTNKTKQNIAEAEWKRIAGNPDNLIISDSLISRIDPHSLGDFENPPIVKPVCQFFFEGYTLSGEVIGFSSENLQRSYTFAATLASASKLMNSANFINFRMLAGENELIAMSKDSITNFNFNVDVQNMSTALVTISFSVIKK